MPPGDAAQERRALSASPLGNPFADNPRLLALILVICTVLAYQPAWHAGFVWDDDGYVTANPLLTARDGLQRIWFSRPISDSYLPMVNTTLRFEHGLWGLNPSGYHCVNILLHSLNALLVWAVLRRLALPGAWLAAAIWALHPVNVESVAWISELKNTQSTLFYLLTLLAWMKFTEAGTVRRWRFYALALLLYAPSLSSKPTACTLPAAMLLVLWLRKQPIDRRRICQIVPFLCCGIVAGLLTVWCEHSLQNSADAVHQSYSVIERPFIAAHALWFYAAKLAWPTQLTFSYPRWEISPRDPRQYAWPLACVAVAGLLWWRRRATGPGPLAAVLFFVATLSPMLGFIPEYTFRYSFVADHYQYVASIGLIALVAAAASSQAEARHLGRHAQCALSVSLLLVLGALTWRQASVYHDVETLFRDTLAKNPQSWMAHHYLGSYLLRKGRLNDAVGHFERALQLNPDLAAAHSNLGVALMAQGKLPEAIGHFEQALRLQPDSAIAHYCLGLALAKTARTQEAIGQYEEALRINPHFVQAQNALARARAVP